MPPRQCYKCKGPELCVSTRHHFSCKSCFLDSIVKMFRGQVLKLGIPRKSKLIIAFSGGCASTALISLFHEVLFLCKSRMDFQIELVYISFDSLSGLIPLYRTFNIRDISNKYPFPLVVIPAESHPLFEGDISHLQAMFSNMKSVDGCTDLMMIVQNHLLRSYVSSIQETTYLLYGYTMDHLTERVVHHLSNALGFDLAYSCSSPVLQKIPGTEHSYIGYPLGGITARELAIYCHYKKVQYTTSFSFLSNKGESVYRLARTMVETLQDECDSTLHIVVETMGKLKRCPEELVDERVVCRLCGDYSSTDLCTRCRFVMGDEREEIIKKYLESML